MGCTGVILVLVGVALEFMGALVIASALWISKRDALESATPEQAALPFEEFVQYVTNEALTRWLLRGRKHLLCGGVVLALGFGLQFAGTLITFPN